MAIREAVVVGALSLMILFGGCGRPVTLSPTTTSQSATSTTSRDPSASGAPPRAQLSAKPALSDAAIAYAKDLGGLSHKGEHLFLIVGGSTETEQKAQTLLDAAIPKFGDMQTYFVVQRSENFEGLRPGWFVVVEAHRKAPRPEDIQLAKRGFRDCYVKSVVVRTNDPLPVYDDLVAQ